MITIVSRRMCGATLIFSGRPKEGLSALATCIRLDPRDPFMSVRLLHIACGLYFAGEYEAVIDAAKRLIRSYPDFPMIYRWPAAALGQLGRTAEAKEWLEKAISAAPAAFNITASRGFGQKTIHTWSRVCGRPAGRADASRQGSYPI
jgi:tetratricopeptide (TPR) repeat protein